MQDFQKLLLNLCSDLGLNIDFEIEKGLRMIIEETFEVQIQLDSYEENILLASRLFELPPGKFRENVLKDCLKTNSEIDETLSVLSYVSRKNLLVLYSALPMQMIDIDKLQFYLLLFIEKARLWYEALQNGKTSPEGAFKSQEPPSMSMFGLKP